MARRTNTPPARKDIPATGTPALTSRRELWLGLALLALVFLAYLPSLSGAFIWDDDAHLTQNPCIVGPLGLPDIWTTPWARICPLVQTTFWLEYHIWGLTPLPYHVVTVLIHAAAAVVLWRVLRRLQIPGAWLGAALWALHPVQVESVAWITELKNTQSGLFFMLAVLSFCKARSGQHRFRLHYAMTLAFGVLAMASKSSTVILPLVLGLCAWWIDRNWNWRRNLMELAPVLFLSMLTSLVTVWTQHGEGAFDPEFARTTAERIADAGKVFWFYAGKLVWPHPLIFIYPKWTADASIVTAYLPTLAAAALVGVLWWQRDRWARSAFLATAYYLAALLPVLGLVDTYFWRYSFVGDHFQYLAGIGPLALAAAGITVGLKRAAASRRRLAQGVGTVLVLMLAVLTWRQCAMYRNDEVLWTTTIRLNPNSWMAHNNLAVELAHQGGRSAEVIKHYERSLELRPNHAKAQYNLGLEISRIPGRENEAIARYEEALRLDPTLGLAHLNLGSMLAMKPGRQAEAIAHYEEAIKLMPDSAEARYNLALELWKQPGHAAEVTALYRDAIRLNPQLAEAHYNLALQIAMQPGGAEEAESLFKEALRLRPDLSDAHSGYAYFLSTRPGRLPESIAQYEEALRLQPNAPIVHYNLAGVLYRSGRLSEAAKHLEAAIELDSNFEDAKRRLASLRQQLGDR